MVTLVSTDHAFGGPLTVALNQAEEMRRRGHDVLLASVSQDHASGLTELSGIPAVLFPAHRLPALRFSGFFSTEMIRWLAVNASTFDVIHIHAGRDLVSLCTMAVALLRHVPYVAQTHGMIIRSAHPLKRVVDLLVATPLLNRSSATLALQDKERQGLIRMGVRPWLLMTLPNGVVIPPQREESRTRSRDRPRVTFCSRLHPRKRVTVFAEMALDLVRRGAEADFVIVGPDDGDLGRLRPYLDHPELAPALSYTGPLSHKEVMVALADSDIFVLPAVNEPFPMVLLEAMALGLPCVCTQGCDIAPQLAASSAAVVSGAEAHALADHVAALLQNGAESARQGRRAREYVRAAMSMTAVGDRLEGMYCAAAGRDASGTSRIAFRGSPGD